MDYAISIKITAKQYYILKGMAKCEYRTIGNMLGALIAEGISFYLTERPIYVKKMEEDWTNEKSKYENYSDFEIIDELEKIAVVQ